MATKIHGTLGKVLSKYIASFSSMLNWTAEFQISCLIVGRIQVVFWMSEKLYKARNWSKYLWNGLPRQTINDYSISGNTKHLKSRCIFYLNMRYGNKNVLYVGCNISGQLFESEIQFKYHRIFKTISTKTNYVFLAICNCKCIWIYHKKTANNSQLFSFLEAKACLKQTLGH